MKDPWKSEASKSSSTNMIAAWVNVDLAATYDATSVAPMPWIYSPSVVINPDAVIVVIPVSLRVVFRSPDDATRRGSSQARNAARNAWPSCADVAQFTFGEPRGVVSVFRGAGDISP